MYYNIEDHRQDLEVQVGRRAQGGMHAAQGGAVKGEAHVEQRGAVFLGGPLQGATSYTRQSPFIADCSLTQEGWHHPCKPFNDLQALGQGRVQGRPGGQTR